MNKEAYWISHTYTYMTDDLPPCIELTRAKNEILMLKRVGELKGNGEKVFSVVWGRIIKI